PEVRCAYTARRGAELWRVQKIVRLIAELHPMPFARRELLETGEVPGLRPRRIEQRHTGVAVAFGADVNTLSGATVALRPDEGGRVEPAVDRAIGPHVVHFLAGDNVRALVG